MLASSLKFLRIDWMLSKKTLVKCPLVAIFTEQVGAPPQNPLANSAWVRDFTKKCSFSVFSRYGAADTDMVCVQEYERCVIFSICAVWKVGY